MVSPRLVQPVVKRASDWVVERRRVRVSRRLEGHNLTDEELERIRPFVALVVSKAGFLSLVGVVAWLFTTFVSFSLVAFGLTVLERPSEAVAFSSPTLGTVTFYFFNVFALTASVVSVYLTVRVAIAVWHAYGVRRSLARNPKEVARRNDEHSYVQCWWSRHEERIEKESVYPEGFGVTEERD